MNRMLNPIWYLKRKYIFWRDDYTCQYCGSKNNSLHIDHIFPKSKGGSDSISNLITSCKSCNLNKGDMTLSEWKGGSRVIIIYRDNLDNDIDTKIIYGIQYKKLIKFLEGIKNGTTLGESNWIGSYNPFSRREYRSFIKELIKINYIEYKNPDYPAQGLKFTDYGYKSLLDILKQNDNSDDEVIYQSES